MAPPWRLVWITGASTGIGAAIAKQLASQGVTVACSSRRAADLVALAAGNPALKPYALDVTDESAVVKCFQKIEKDLGQIDLVIAGAGTYAPATSADFQVDAFKRMYEVNFLGVIRVLAAVLPVFRARRAGHISWIASVAGYRGLPKSAAYGPTKAALINLAESIKPELDLDNVTISVINPGFVKTPMTAKNDFPMPFLMDVDDAARATIAGLQRRKFEIAYPKRFVLILKIARLLPITLYFWLIKRFVLKA